MRWPYISIHKSETKNDVKLNTVLHVIRDCEGGTVEQMQARKQGQISYLENLVNTISQAGKFGQIPYLVYQKTVIGNMCIF